MRRFVDYDSHTHYSMRRFVDDDSHTRYSMRRDDGRNDLDIRTSFRSCKMKLLLIIVVFLPSTVFSQDCSPLPTYPNTIYTSKGQGGHVDITCDPGFARLDGNQGAVTCKDGTWSDTGPFCGVQCPNPPVPDNGDTVSNGNDVEGDTATVSCNEGYNNNGPTTLTCTDSGTWDPDISGSVTTQCSIVNCNAPANPTDATITATTTTFGATAPIVCNIGYEFMIGADELVTCLASGSWDPDPNTITPCQVVNCGTPTAPTYSQIALDSGTSEYQDTATISCDVGAELVAMAVTSITCESDGSWSPDPSTLTVCQLIDCGAATAPGNAVSTLDSGTSYYNDMATIDCNTGYEFANGMTTISLTCQLSGSWNPDPTALSACTLKDCGALPSAPADSTINLATPGVTTYGATAQIVCDENYQLNPAVSDTLTCDENKQWIEPINGAITYCEFTECDPLPEAPEFTSLSIPDADITFGTEATINCLDGFDKITGTIDTITCQGDGSWSPDLTGITDPFCGRKDCGALPSAPANTIITLDVTSSTTFESTATISCADGYELVAGVVTTLTCGSDATWGPDITDVTFCRIKVCSVLPSPPDNTFITLDVPGSATFQSTASISCADGYELVPGVFSTLTCGSDATWGPDITDVTFCRRKDCGLLPNDPQYTVIVLESGTTTYQSTALIRCVDGYDPIDGVANKITCGADGTWGPDISGIQFCEIIDCQGLPTAPENTVITLDQEASTYLSTATLGCVEGYEIIVQSTISISCDTDGTWTPDISNLRYCQPVTCNYYPAAPANGLIQLTDGTLVYNSTAEVMCLEHYQLIPNLDPILICDQSGMWSPDVQNLAFCQLITCSTLPLAPENAIITLGSGATTYQSTATISCKPGFNLIAGRETMLSCNDEGDWHPSILDADYCERKDCGTPQTSPGTQVVLTEPGVTTYGATASITCSERYQRTSADQIITCNLQGAWEPSLTNTLFCQLITCSTLPIAPENAIITLATGATTYQSTATISCTSGYEIIPGVETGLTCDNQGDWTPAVLSTEYCQRKDCGTPQGLNGTVIVLSNPGVTTYRATAEVSCTGGYQRTSVDPIITCNGQGVWDPYPQNTLFCQNPIDPCISAVCASDESCDALEGIPTCVSSVEHNAYIAMVGMVFGLLLLLILPLIIHIGRRRYKKKREPEPEMTTVTALVRRPTALRPLFVRTVPKMLVGRQITPQNASGFV